MPIFTKINIVCMTVTYYILTKFKMNRIERLAANTLLII